MENETWKPLVRPCERSALGHNLYPGSPAPPGEDPAGVLEKVNFWDFESFNFEKLKIFENWKFEDIETLSFWKMEHIETLKIELVYDVQYTCVLS